MLRSMGKLPRRCRRGGGGFSWQAYKESALSLMYSSLAAVDITDRLPKDSVGKLKDQSKDNSHAANSLWWETGINMVELNS